MTLVWVEEFDQLLISTEKKLLDSEVPPLDRQHHRTKVCYLPGCQGATIMGGQVVRHLRGKHGLSAADAKSWRVNLSDQVRDVEYDPVIQEIFEWSRPQSCRSKMPQYFSKKSYR